MHSKKSVKLNEVEGSTFENKVCPDPCLAYTVPYHDSTVYSYVIVFISVRLAFLSDTLGFCVGLPTYP